MKKQLFTRNLPLFCIRHVFCVGCIAVQRDSDLRNIDAEQTIQQAICGRAEDFLENNGLFERKDKKNNSNKKDDLKSFKTRQNKLYPSLQVAVKMTLIAINEIKKQIKKVNFT